MLTKACDAITDHLASEDLENRQRRIQLDIVEQVCELSRNMVALRMKKEGSLPRAAMISIATATVDAVEAMITIAVCSTDDVRNAVHKVAIPVYL